MEIIKKQNKDELILALVGSLNSSTFEELEDVISDSLKGIKTLIFDLKKLEYISSAGLRVLLTAKKIMDKQGKMIIRNATDDVMDIFVITGFSSILDFE